jgi:hypothetical protein
MHKRNIMLNYMNYVIRKHGEELLSLEFLKIVETVVHSNDSVPISTMCLYFATHMLQYYIAHSSMDR